MFDIGFTELMVIGVVALVVIGPEKLPKVARTVGAYLGRLQRYVNDVKADINREMELDELRKFKQTVEDTARGFETSVTSEMNSAQSELDRMAKEFAEATNPLSSDPDASTGAALEPFPYPTSASMAAQADIAGVAGLEQRAA